MMIHTEMISSLCVKALLQGERAESGTSTSYLGRVSHRYIAYTVSTSAAYNLLTLCPLCPCHEIVVFYVDDEMEFCSVGLNFIMS